jgi:hypothetical protein
MRKLYKRFTEAQDETYSIWRDQLQQENLDNRSEEEDDYR